MNDPFLLNILTMFGVLAIAAPVGFWLMPKLDNATTRFFLWRDERRERRLSRGA